jgi:hypothetical protein
MSGAVDPYALAVAPTGARLSEGLDQPARQNAKGLSRSIKLTETQLMMLSAAAQRNDRHLIAAPSLKGAAAQKIEETDRRWPRKGSQSEGRGAGLASRRRCRVLLCAEIDHRRDERDRDR